MKPVSADALALPGILLLQAVSGGQEERVGGVRRYQWPLRAQKAAKVGSEFGPG